MPPLYIKYTIFHSKMERPYSDFFMINFNERLTYGARSDESALFASLRGGLVYILADEAIQDVRDCFVGWILTIALLAMTDVVLRSPDVNEGSLAMTAYI